MLLKTFWVVERLTSRRERVLCCGSDVSSPARPWLRLRQGVLPGSPVRGPPSPLVLCSWLSFKVKSGPANPQTVKGLSQRPGLRGARAESS